MTFRAVVIATTILGNALPGSVPAQQPQAYSRPFISANQAVVSGLVLFATAFGDEGLREELQEHRGSGSNSLARVGNAFGEPLYVFSAIGAGYLAGQVTGSSELSRLSLKVGAAALVAGGITTALKLALGRTRPTNGGDSDHFRPFSGSASFPSGHTTLAFAVATVIADETADSWSDMAVYGAASLTGLARMNDDRHWASDVLAGALVGHLTARWLNRKPGLLSISPRSVGVSLSF